MTSFNLITSLKALQSNIVIFGGPEVRTSTYKFVVDTI